MRDTIRDWTGLLVGIGVGWWLEGRGDGAVCGGGGRGRLLGVV